MSQHKSISKREGSLYHTIADAGLLERLKFINKGDLYQVYGKPFPDTWITDEIKESKAYQMYFKNSTSLIPPKKSRGRVVMEGKTTVTPEKPTKQKKKPSKKKQVLRDESNESKGELENRQVNRKIRTPRAIVIQEPPSVLVKKIQESLGKLKGIEISSEGTGVSPRVPDKLTGVSAVSRKRVGTSPKVPNEKLYNYEALCDDDVWGSTDEETNKDKNEDYDEDDDNEEEESVNEKENIVAKTEEEETANSEYEEDDTKGEDQKTEEEPKGDDQAKEDEVGAPDLNESFHEVKVSVIPEPTQQLPSTPPLPVTEDPAAPVINFEAVDCFLHKFHALKKDVQELKQVDHSAAILESIKSQVPSIVKDSLGSNIGDELQKVLQSHTEGLKKELIVKKVEYKEFINELVTNEATNQLNHENDQDEDPSARPNQGKESKKRRTGKEAESSKKSSTPKESTKSKPPSKSSKTSKSAPADQSIKEHEHETIDDALEQPWFNEIINAKKSPLTFDELMSKPNNFSAYAMNRLKLTKLTRELEWTNLEGYNCLVDMRKPLPLQEKEGRLIIPIEVFFNNNLEYLKWDKAERTYSSSITKILAASVAVEKKCGYSYLKEIVVRRADQQLYRLKEGDFPDLHLNDIKDMLLLLTQKILFNLGRDVIVHLGVALRMFTLGIVLQFRVKDVQLGVASSQRKLNLTSLKDVAPTCLLKNYIL
ncbi:hypothetical protein Tco_1088152 [Tanacetum coccineum]